MSDEFRRIIDTTIKASESFYQQFFRALDQTHHNLPQLLRDDTAIVFNGTPIGGKDAFLTMYSQMPQSSHEVTSYNVHPLPSTQGSLYSMMVQTSGKVKYGTERGKNLHGFAATFFVQYDQPSNQSQCTSLSYRLVHRPEDSDIQM